jgi:hypothetical protein
MVVLALVFNSLSRRVANPRAFGIQKNGIATATVIVHASHGSNRSCFLTRIRDGTRCRLAVNISRTGTRCGGTIDGDALINSSITVLVDLVAAVAGLARRGRHIACREAAAPCHVFRIPVLTEYLLFRGRNWQLGVEVAQSHGYLENRLATSVVFHRGIPGKDIASVGL